MCGSPLITEFLGRGFRTCEGHRTDMHPSFFQPRLCLVCFRTCQIGSLAIKSSSDIAPGYESFQKPKFLTITESREEVVAKLFQLLGINFPVSSIKNRNEIISLGENYYCINTLWVFAISISSEILLISQVNWFIRNI